MSITESITFWAGKMLFDIMITFVILAMVLIIAYVIGDHKMGKRK
jgi:hypothetical protein